MSDYQEVLEKKKNQKMVYVHSPSKCLVRFGLYGVKWP